jgi:hypothetical protein
VFGQKVKEIFSFSMKGSSLLVKKDSGRVGLAVWFEDVSMRNPRLCIKAMAKLLDGLGASFLLLQGLDSA